MADLKVEFADPRKKEVVYLVVETFVPFQKVEFYQI
jgi:hypothetical protein